jgi:peroxiredoxin
MTKIKIQNIAICLGWAILMACTNTTSEERSNQASLSGQISNIPEGQKILIYRVEAQAPIKIDSVNPDGEGKFEIQLPADSERIYLLGIGEQRAPIFLESGKHEIKGDFNALARTLGFSNSDLMLQLKKVNGLKDGFDQEAEQMQIAFQKFSILKQRQKADSVEKQFQSLLFQNKAEVKRLIDSIGPNPVSHIASSMLSIEEDFEYLDSLAKRFTSEKPKAYFTTKLNAYVEGYRKFAIGSIAPDFIQPDPNGKEVQLSSFKGKWLLLDFWASWCKPCRAENPNLVEAYNRYKNKNFNIFSVSLDSDKSAWMKAMIADHMLWSHASDLKGWENSAARAYQINSIPMSLLLDPNGKIMAKNLRGEALQQKLAALIPGK